jgi:beta-lactamase class A
MKVTLGSALLAATLTLVVACGSGDSTEDPGVEVVIGDSASATPGSGVLGAEATPPASVPGTLRTPAVVSLDWLAGNAAIPELPPFAAAGPDQPLIDAVRVALTGAPGHTSVVVHSLRDGRYAAINETDIYYAASLFKMGIMLEAYRQRDAGKLDFAKLLTLEEKYVQYDLGTLDELKLEAGDMLTVADAVKAMTVLSDTPTAVLMQETVGCTTADQTLVALGIKDTRFCNRSLPATAADMTTLIEAVASGAGVSNASRLEMLSLMSQEQYRQGVIAGVPAGTVVAHKSGSYTSATHDVALVWGPAGPYVIAVMTDQPSNWPAIAAVSLAVWSHLSAYPGP